MTSLELLLVAVIVTVMECADNRDYKLSMKRMTHPLYRPLVTCEPTYQTSAKSDLLFLAGHSAIYMARTEDLNFARVLNLTVGVNHMATDRTEQVLYWTDQERALHRFQLSDFSSQNLYPHRGFHIAISAKTRVIFVSLCEHGGCGISRISLETMTSLGEFLEIPKNAGSLSVDDTEG
ncbi:uncharacterized protein [Diadema setosum]|uniref:uncharacterized protein n=1 Tax=Diadema setosum TaxID=31175 RepID=UPI003B3A0189